MMRPFGFKLQILDEHFKKQLSFHQFIVIGIPHKTYLDFTLPFS